MLTYSDACERNKDPILQILKSQLYGCRTVLEIGSGSAQHAVHFAHRLPNLIWFTSDIADNLENINTRLEMEGSENAQRALELDVSQFPWPLQAVDAIFSANTLHIISWQHVECFFQGAGQILGAGGKLIVYGPFRYNEQYTSESNAQFDVWLKQRDPESAIRDFEAVDALARKQDLILVDDFAMPANNQIVVWHKQ